MVNHNDEFTTACQRAESVLANKPTAIAAKYDRQIERIVIDLSSGLTISFKPSAVQGLEKAKPEHLSEIDITPSGLGLHFPIIDADIYLPAILEGFLGSRSWMAEQLGKAGGASRSAAKIAAVRANGKLGERPRKIQIEKVS